MKISCTMARTTGNVKGARRRRRSVCKKSYAMAVSAKRTTWRSEAVAGRCTRWYLVGGLADVAFAQQPDLGCEPARAPVVRGIPGNTVRLDEMPTGYGNRRRCHMARNSPLSPTSASARTPATRMPDARTCRSNVSACRHVS